MRSRDREKLRKETLLRAEYVLPGRDPTLRNERDEIENNGAELSSLLDPLETAMTECTIAQAQLVNRVESLTRRGQGSLRTFTGKWLPIAFGLGATFVVGLSLLSVALLGRRRSTGWGELARSHRAWPGPVAMELLKAVGVGVGYLSQRVLDQRLVGPMTQAASPVNASK